MEGQTHNSVNLEIPSRWRRFSAYLLDLLINITVIGVIFNIIIVLIRRATLGNMIIGIKVVDNDNKIGLGKAILRYLLLYSTFFIFVFIIHIFLSVILWGNGLFCYLGIDDILCDIHNTTLMITEISSSMIIINIIELFFKCPTFIDKLLGIKRIYKKS